MSGMSGPGNVLKMRPHPLVRYHDAHCDQTVSLSRLCSMSLYLSVAASVGATLVSAPERTGSRGCRKYGTYDSSEKITEVFPVLIFGPQQIASRRWDSSRGVPCIMKKFGKPGTVLPRYAVGPSCAS